MQPMIELDGLTKKYPHKDKNGHDTYKTAVEHLSFAVGKGEAFGLLGPNGAGKTTTIRMLTLLMEPTSGVIRYDGDDVRGHEQAIKQLIGVVPQHVNFDQDLTVGENMELHARLHHMGKREREVRIRELLRYVELGDIVGNALELEERDLGEDLRIVKKVLRELE